jgi:hypothetical protein
MKNQSSPPAMRRGFSFARRVPVPRRQGGNPQKKSPDDQLGLDWPEHGGTLKGCTNLRWDGPGMLVIFVLTGPPSLAAAAHQDADTALYKTEFLTHKFPEDPTRSWCASGAT